MEWHDNGWNIYSNDEWGPLISLPNHANMQFFCAITYHENDRKIWFFSPSRNLIEKWPNHASSRITHQHFVESWSRKNCLSHNHANFFVKSRNHARKCPNHTTQTARVGLMMDINVTVIIRVAGMEQNWHMVLPSVSLKRTRETIAVYPFCIYRF